MISNTQEIIDRIEERLNRVEKAATDQDRMIKQLYDELYKKKLKIEEYKEKCGALPSTEGSGSRDNE